MALRVDPDQPASPSRQIVEEVLDLVAGGAWGSGARLPSVRDAAAEALVNPNTIARAWRELEVLGIVAGRAGSGVFVTEDGPEIARRERRRETLTGLRRALDEALRSGHEPEIVRDETEKAVKRTRGEAVRVGRGGGR
jgi:GntR family transcriptional regulator